MNRGLRLALLLGIALIALALLRGGDKKNLDQFARCLADKKVAMYGQVTCPHCKDQRDMFGDSFKYVPYVECRVNGKIAEECKAQGIRFTPTWVFSDGTRHERVMSLEQLAQKTGCSLP